MISAAVLNGSMATGQLKVEVAAVLPGRQQLVTLHLPVGSTVQDALIAANLSRVMPGLAIVPDRIGIFGRPCSPEQVLKDGDRVEIYRPLKADPKEVRRQLAAIERQRGRESNKD